MLVCKFLTWKEIKFTNINSFIPCIERHITRKLDDESISCEFHDPIGFYFNIISHPIPKKESIQDICSRKE